MRTWKMFLACRLKTANARQRTWQRGLSAKDNELKGYIATQLAQVGPKDAFVNAPHKIRKVEFLLVVKRKMDDDAVGNALKPVIDVLKCGRRKNCDQNIVYRDGLFWDDSPKYLRMTFAQATLGEVGFGAQPGVFIMLTEEVEPEVKRKDIGDLKEWMGKRIP